MYSTLNETRAKNKGIGAISNYAYGDHSNRSDNDDDNDKNEVDEDDHEDEDDDEDDGKVW